MLPEDLDLSGDYSDRGVSALLCQRKHTHSRQRGCKSESKAATHKETQGDRGGVLLLAKHLNNSATTLPYICKSGLSLVDMKYKPNVLKQCKKALFFSTWVASTRAKVAVSLPPFKRYMATTNLAFAVSSLLRLLRSLSFNFHFCLGNLSPGSLICC